MLTVFWWTKVFIIGLQRLAISFKTIIASFEFQKTWIGPQNMLHFLDRTTMIK